VRTTLPQLCGSCKPDPFPRFYRLFQQCHTQDFTPFIFQRAVSISGCSAFPHAFSPDQAKDVLVVAWAGMEILLKKVKGCLGGTLAKAPVAAINALIDVKNERCQSHRTTSLLNICIRQLETTRAPSKS
jgi:hypothetical protein